MINQMLGVLIVAPQELVEGEEYKVASSSWSDEVRLQSFQGTVSEDFPCLSKLMTAC